MIDVRTIYKVREDDGVNVLPVTNVPGLVSVAEVEQTVSTTEPGGENVLEVRLTDGTTTEFSVYNGSYAGPEGSIEVVNDLTTESTTKALSAAQGKALKDMIADIDIPIVNDLTTGGTTSALSAEMGKQLHEDLEAIDFTDADGVALTSSKIKITTDNDDYVSHTDDDGVHAIDFFIQDGEEAVAPRSVKDELDAVADNVITGDADIELGTTRVSILN
jgi:hypothetical protein